MTAAATYLLIFEDVAFSDSEAAEEVRVCFPPVGREFLRARAFFAVEEGDEPDSVTSRNGVLAPFSFGGEAVHGLYIKKTIERSAFYLAVLCRAGFCGAEGLLTRVNDCTDNCEKAIGGCSLSKVKSKLIELNYKEIWNRAAGCGLIAIYFRAPLLSSPLPPQSCGCGPMSQKSGCPEYDAEGL